MQFVLAHEFAASALACEAALIHPEYLPFLLARSDRFSSVMVELDEDDGIRIHRRARITIRSPVERIGPKTVDPRWCEFVDEITWDRRTRRLRFSYFPEYTKIAERILFRGEQVFEESAPSMARRWTQFEISVRDLPLLLRPFAGVIEGLLEREAKRAADEEAEALRAWLTELSRRAACSSEAATHADCS